MKQNIDNITRLAGVASAQQKQAMDTISVMQADYSRRCERISHAIDDALAALNAIKQ